MGGSGIVRAAIVPGVVGAAVVPAVVGLRVVGWAEVIEQEREWERNTETHALGPGRELRENQGANGEEKNQQLFHFANTCGDCPKPAINQLKRDAQSHAIGGRSRGKKAKG